LGGFEILGRVGFGGRMDEGSRFGCGMGLSFGGDLGFGFGLDLDLGFFFSNGFPGESVSHSSEVSRRNRENRTASDGVSSG